MKYDDGFLQGKVDEYKAKLSKKSPNVDFVDNALKIINASIADVGYLQYGMYWWAVKKLLADRGVAEYGQNYDGLMLSMFELPTDELTVMAAFEYRDYYNTHYMQGNREHDIEGQDPYILYDVDMENVS